jgi:hypothetical protein
MSASIDRILAHRDVHANLGCSERRTLRGATKKTDDLPEEMLKIHRNFNSMINGINVKSEGISWK